MPKLPRITADKIIKAFKNGKEVLELIVEEYQEDGKPLPKIKSLVFA